MERISQALGAINGRVYDDLVPMLVAIGASGELIRNGALTVYESEAGRERDRARWELKRRLGVEAEFLDRNAIEALEPALGPLARCGVFTPQWSQVADPKQLVEGLRDWVCHQGATMITGEVAEIAGTEGPGVRLTDGRMVATEQVIVAAGAWSGRLARQIGDPVSLESERGYNTTIALPGIHLGREIIFAERSFVSTPLRCGLRIGGAAEFGGLDAVANYARSRALAVLASRYLPGLRQEGGQDWAGHRPTTPDSLPVIGRSPRRRDVLYAFGHGHLGLTQAATTGRLIADLVAGRPTPIDVGPFAISRFG